MSKVNLMQTGFNSIMKEVDKNLPSVLMGASKLLTPIGMYATYKKAPAIKETLQTKVAACKALPKDAPFKDKAATYLDAVLSVGKEAAIPATILVLDEICMFGAEKEFKNRIGLLGTALVASQVDKKELKETAQEMLGKKKVKQIEEKAAEKKVARSINPNDPVIFDDADPEHDCIFLEENSGTVWRDNYLNVDKIVDKAYEQVHHNHNNLRLDEFFGMLNENRVSNKIRNRRSNNIWVYSASEYNDLKCHDRDDFMMIENAGFAPNGMKAFIIRSNPTVSDDIYAGQKFDDATSTVGWDNSHLLEDCAPAFYDNPDWHDTNETTILDVE